MSASLKDQRLSQLATAVSLLFVLWVAGAARGRNVAAQQQLPWTPQQTIPGFHPATRPPVLLADQNRTVHAISSHWVGEESNRPILAIAYNRWSIDGDWTEPNDVLLPPLKQQARILDGFLDKSGTIHIAFFSGDDTEANIYYSQAQAVNAQLANAWSAPLLVGSHAITPEDGIIAGDNRGNLVIVYSGSLLGRGLYATYSSNGGADWTEPSAIYLTLRTDFTPTFIDIYPGHTGQFHTVWSVHDIANLGQAIYYSQFYFDDIQWSNPIVLAESRGGLGTQAPVIIQKQERLIVMYYDSQDGKQHFIQSYDSGQTWTNPAAPFRHVGLNGAGDLIIDSSDVLHYFWGQRISGSPDIHGMWHSMLRGNNWTEPEAVVSGPTVKDQIGNKAFDPNDARAVISQGNTVLVTWRTDPGLKGNGVWHSFSKIDAAETPLATLPASVPDYPSGSQPTSEQISVITPPTIQLTVQEGQENTVSSGEQNISPQSNPPSVMFIALIPVALLSTAIIIWHQRKAHR